MPPKPKVLPSRNGSGLESAKAFFSNEFADMFVDTPSNAIGWRVTKINGQAFSFEYIIAEQNYYDREEEVNEEEVDEELEEALAPPKKKIIGKRPLDPRDEEEDELDLLDE